jgi:hypothetical protein
MPLRGVKQQKIRMSDARLSQIISWFENGVNLLPANLYSAFCELCWHVAAMEDELSHLKSIIQKRGGV